MRALELAGVVKDYRGLRPLRIADLVVEEGERVAIAGLRSPRRRGVRRPGERGAAAGRRGRARARPLDRRHHRGRRLALVARRVRHPDAARGAAGIIVAGAEPGLAAVARDRPDAGRAARQGRCARGRSRPARRAARSADRRRAADRPAPRPPRQGARARAARRAAGASDHHARPGRRPAVRRDREARRRGAPADGRRRHRGRRLRRRRGDACLQAQWRHRRAHVDARLAPLPFRSRGEVRCTTSDTYRLRLQHAVRYRRDAGPHRAAPARAR